MPKQYRGLDMWEELKLAGIWIIVITYLWIVLYVTNDSYGGLDFVMKWMRVVL